MRKLGRQYVSQFNVRHGRSGTLWEGRYKSCLVDSETYVLRCYRYIDLNPTRAHIVADPCEFLWSQHPRSCGAPIRCFADRTSRLPRPECVTSRGWIGLSSAPPRNGIGRRDARHSHLSTAAARPGARRIQSHGGGQDTALRRHSPRPSAAPEVNLTPFWTATGIHSGGFGAQHRLRV